MKNKTILIIFFMPITIFAFIIFGLFIADPLQLLHPYSKKKGFISNARHQMLNIINEYSFDSIILGSSMLENTSSKESSNILGGKFMNLSLSGADFNTRSIILNYTLKNKKIKKVIYSLDDSDLVELKVSKTNNFDFLYDDNKLNDARLYVNAKYLICSIFNSHCLADKDIDRPFAWYQSRVHSKRFGGLDNWFKSNNDSQIRKAFKSILKSIEQIKLNKKEIDINLKSNLEKLKQNINTTLIKYISSYPDTKFILIIPPYSRIKYAINAQYKVSSFEKYKSSIKYLVLKSSEYSNLSIYGWGNHSFIDDITNYKDLHHYEYKINSWMLGAIREQEGLLNISNIDDYLDIFTKKALSYDLFELGEKIDYYLKSK